MTEMVSSEAALKPRHPDAQVSALHELVAPRAGLSVVSDSGTLPKLFSYARSATRRVPGCLAKSHPNFKAKLHYNTFLF